MLSMKCGWTRTTVLAIAFAIFTVVPEAEAASSKGQPAQSRSASNGSARKSAASAKRELDTDAVHKLYLDGEFEQAIDMLEKGMKADLDLDHQDSVFIFKHLGVMYAARYETRERGKYYMHQLLMTEPTARIMDMYASDMIYMIFKNIQDEFEATRVRLTHADSLVKGNAQTGPNPTSAQPKPGQPAGDPEKGGGHAALWIGATGAVVVAGVAAFFLLSEKPSVNTTDHPIE